MNNAIQRRVAAVEGLAFSSLRNLIEWGNDYKVYQPEIDTQHEEVFKLALEASNLARDKADLERLRVVFGKFGNVLNAHFRYEEAELEKRRYPKLEEHRAQHAAMLTEFDFIRQRLAGKVDGWPFQEEALVILNVMLGVTVGHILHSDVDYAQHMQESQHAV